MGNVTQTMANVNAKILEKLILFLDESGLDNISKKIDPKYPLFGIGGSVFNEEKYHSSEDEKIRSFKRDVFGKDSIILRSYDIRRKQNEFQCLNDLGLCNRFKDEYDNLITKLDFTFVSRVINKEAHLKKYRHPFPPYEFALELLMESYSKILMRRNAIGCIMLESRDKKPNKQIRHAFINIMTKGTQFVPATQLTNTISTLEFSPKKNNINGLQISDLGIYTVTSASQHSNFTRRDFSVLQKKFDPYHGLKHFP